MYDTNYIVKVAKALEPTIFNDEQLEIINELLKYQDYYDNDVFKHIVRVNPEYEQRIYTSKSYIPTQVPLNYSRLIVDKLSSWQFQEGIDFNCVSKSNQNRADEIEEDLYLIHKQNKMDEKLLQAVTEANISGGVAFKLKYDEANKYVRILPRNRIECFPVYEFDDYENIYRVHFIAFQDEKTIWKQTYDFEAGVCYIEEALYDVQNISVPKSVIIPRQKLGFNGRWVDFLPVYIIPNIPQLGEVWGLSELSDLIPIIDEINRKYSDLSDSLRFDMFAITVMLNMQIDSDNPPKTKAGAIWDLAGGTPDGARADVFKLESQFSYIESLKYHIDSLVSYLFEFSQVVNLSVDRVSGMGSLSGVALKLLFSSIISKTGKKNIIWAVKLRDIYLGALKMRQIYEGYDIPEDLDIEVIMHNPIPQNEQEEVNVLVQKITAGLISITNAMNELGIENPEEEIAKIIEEKKMFDRELSIETRNE